eukprot:6482529-Lingulodinium_polyedra.AAC.1
MPRLANMTLQVAKSFLPKEKGVWLQPYEEKRQFQQYYPCTEPPRSKVFTYVIAGPGPSMEQCLMACI